MCGRRDFLFVEENPSELFVAHITTNLLLLVMVMTKRLPDRSHPFTSSVSLAPHPNDLTGSQRSLLVRGSHWLVLQGCNGCTLLLALFRCLQFWGEVFSFLWESPWWSTFRAHRWGLSKAHTGPLLLRQGFLGFFLSVDKSHTPPERTHSTCLALRGFWLQTGVYFCPCVVCLNLFLRQVAVFVRTAHQQISRWESCDVR